jgi:hypothetical protein
MEELAFSGVVASKSPGIHRHDVDTLTIKIFCWSSSDPKFTGETYLKKTSDSTLLLFVSYSEALYSPNQIEAGDSVAKKHFDFDFTIYNKNGLPRKTLSLLFCSYENPDSIIRKGDFVFGTYGTYFNKEDTLFSGNLINGARQGEWRYYMAHANGNKILQGVYRNNKRDGTFKKYYESTEQLMYEEAYHDNLPDGPFTWWYSNGKLESKRFYKNGNPTGQWEFYNKDGRLIDKKSYN